MSWSLSVTDVIQQDLTVLGITESKASQTAWESFGRVALFAKRSQACAQVKPGAWSFYRETSHTPSVSQQC